MSDSLEVEIIEPRAPLAPYEHEDFVPDTSTARRFDESDAATKNEERWEKILELSLLGWSPTKIGREMQMRPADVKKFLAEWSRHWISHPETVERNARLINDVTQRLHRVANDAAESARLSLNAGKTTAANLALAEERNALLSIVKINGAEPAKKTESKNVNLNIGVEALSIDELEQLASRMQ